MTAPRNRRSASPHSEEYARTSAERLDQLGFDLVAEHVVGRDPEMLYVESIVMGRRREKVSPWGDYAVWTGVDWTSHPEPGDRSRGFQVGAGEYDLTREEAYEEFEDRIRRHARHRWDPVSGSAAPAGRRTSGGGVYTMDDWYRDRKFSAVPGQEVSAEVYEENQFNGAPRRIPMSLLDRYGCVRGYLTGMVCADPELYNAFGETPDGRYLYLGRSKKIEGYPVGPPTWFKEFYHEPRRRGSGKAVSRTVKPKAEPKAKTPAKKASKPKSKAVTRSGTSRPKAASKPKAKPRTKGARRWPRHTATGSPMGR